MLAEDKRIDTEKENELKQKEELFLYNNKFRPGLLDKIFASKNKIIETINVSIVKVSSDPIIQVFSLKFISKLLYHFKPKEVNTPSSMSNLLDNNIGINELKNNKLIITESNGEERTNVGLNKYILFGKSKQFNICDYNYLLSKKFKYFKTDAFNSSTTFIIIININDNRGIENLKTIVNELKGLEMEKKLKFIYKAILITNNENVLASLGSETQIDYIKNSFSFNTFIEADLDDDDYTGLFEKLFN